MNDILNNTKDFIIKKSPEILTIFGIANMALSVIFAVKSANKTSKIVEKVKKDDSCDKKAVEIVKKTWKSYIPSALFFVSGSACIVSASIISNKRMGVLASACAISDTALLEYKHAVSEELGTNQYNKVKDYIAKKKIEENPVKESEVIFTNSGDTLCYDSISGRYFKSDIETIKKIVNELNKKMLNEMTVSLNEFYYEVGLDNIILGDTLIWDINDGLIDIDISSQIAPDNQPCIVIEYNPRPKVH